MLVGVRGSEVVNKGVIGGLLNHFIALIVLASIKLQNDTRFTNILFECIENERADIWAMFQNEREPTFYNAYL